MSWYEFINWFKQVFGSSKGQVNSNLNSPSNGGSGLTSPSSNSAYNSEIENYSSSDIKSAVDSASGGLVSYISGDSDDSVLGALAEWLIGANPATTRSWNAEQAQIERDWQTEMSNTAYQRSTSDMQKAGINPILAYSQGGATSTTGASASSVPNSAGSIAPILQSVSQLVLGLQKEDRLSDKQAADSALSALKFADSHSASQVSMNSARAYERLTHARASLAEDDMRRRYTKRSR